MRAVQRRLKELGFYTSNVDGNYDSETEKAVIAFQKANELTANGEVDEKTLNMMNQEDVITPSTVVYYNPNGGAYYHRDQNCKRIAEKFLPLEGEFIYADIDKEPYCDLKPCMICCDPLHEK